MGISETPNVGLLWCVSVVLGPTDDGLRPGTITPFITVSRFPAPLHGLGAHYNSYSKKLFRGWLLLSALLVSRSSV